HKPPFILPLASRGHPRLQVFAIPADAVPHRTFKAIGGTITQNRFSLAHVEPLILTRKTQFYPRERRHLADAQTPRQKRGRRAKRPRGEKRDGLGGTRQVHEIGHLEEKIPLRALFSVRDVEDLANRLGALQRQIDGLEQVVHEGQVKQLVAPVDEQDLAVAQVLYDRGKEQFVPRPKDETWPQHRHRDPRFSAVFQGQFFRLNFAVGIVLTRGEVRRVLLSTLMLAVPGDDGKR